MKSLVLIGFALLTAIGCGSIPHINKPVVSGDPCSQADWFEVGRLDGLQGLAVETSTYAGRCRHLINQELYLAGWNRGLIDYCTAERGFDVGRAGIEYAEVCPPSTAADFLSAYERGREILKIERDNAGLESEIGRLSRLLDHPETTGMHAVPEIRRDLQKLRERRAQNESSIRSIETARRL